MSTPGTSSPDERWKHLSPGWQSRSESQSEPPYAHGRDGVQPDTSIATPRTSPALAGQLPDVHRSLTQQ